MSVEGIFAHRREIKSVSKRSAARDLLTIPPPPPLPILTPRSRYHARRCNKIFNSVIRNRRYESGEIKHVCTARPQPTRCCIQESGLADRDNDTDPNATDKRQPGARGWGKGRLERLGIPSVIPKNILSHGSKRVSPPPRALSSVFLPPPLS